MPALPLLPSGILPPAAILLRCLEALRSEGVEELACLALPRLNGSLPDLLRTAGIRTLVVGGLPLPSLRWEGWGGSRIEARDDQAPFDAEPGGLHHGDLPAGATLDRGDDRDLLALLEQARLEDAGAVLGKGAGADWSRILAACGPGQATHRTAPGPVACVMPGDHLGVWNPLPFGRDLVVALPALRRSWGMVDTNGARHPAQMVDGPGGRELLVALHLGALGSTVLEPLDDPVPGPYWEVDGRTLDNGVLRAELDELGQVVRLCFAGVFAELAGPVCAPSLDGLPLAGKVVVAVLEDGPVRAKVLVTRRCEQGVLRLTYTLHAWESVLRVEARWSGAGELAFDHPTAYRGCQLHAAGDLARSAITQAAVAGEDLPVPVEGVRWAALGDAAGRGLALLGPQPLTVAARAGSLRVQGRCEVDYALASAQPPAGSGLGQLALSLTVPGQPWDGALPGPAPFRLADLGGLVPLWVRRPEGWAGELLLADQGAARGRAFLFPCSPPTEAWRVGPRGETLQRLPLAPEGDAVIIEHAAGEILNLRWR